ncbi:hypothetical protein MCEMSE15_00596 [Fimbriimonadaceae bacterium]|jgi:hypothetical protein
MKTVQNVKNSLKFKAAEKDGVLSIKIGVKKYTVPIKARMIAGEGYLFLSFPASSELYQVDKKQLVAMGKEDDASEAFDRLNSVKPKARGRRAGGGAALSDDLAKALAGLPAGFKIGYGADGVPRLVKTRVRKKRGEK